MNSSKEKRGAATPQITRIADKKSVNTKVNPIINFQIGLIAALVAAFLIMELSTPNNLDKEPIASTVPISDDLGYTGPVQIIRNKKPLQEIKKPKELQPKVVKTDPNKAPEIVKTEVVDTPIVNTDTNNVAPVKLDNIGSESHTMDTGKNTQSTTSSQPTFLGALTEAPLFPGCSARMNKEERVDCLNKKMARYIQRKFDTNLSNTVNGKNVVKISVQFTIGMDGLTKDIVVKAPNKELENEAYKVISSLPQMTPGKINNQAVNVTYALPIRFQVND